MNKLKQVIESIKNFFKEPSEQESIYLLKLDEMKKAICLGIGYVDEDKPIPTELIKYIDEPIASYLRWTKFNMTKQQVEEMFHKYGIFHLYGLQTILDNKESELPYTSKVLKLIRLRIKLEEIDGDFK